MPNSVIVSLMGGLGNQLFSFAAAKALADQLGCPIVVDTTREAHRVAPADGIESFALECQFVNLLRGPGWNSRATALLTRVTWKVGLWKKTWQRPLRLYFSPVPGFDPNLMAVDMPIRLRGLFQDYRYAEMVWRDERMRAIPLRDPSEWFLRESERAVIERPIMLHVRRGDFRAHKSFGLLSPDYYRSVVREDVQLAGTRPVWVFSDEPEVVESLGIAGARFVRSPRGAAEDMVLMSKGSALIIANSTFSWWSAWMAGLQARVYAPEPWFRSEPWAESLHVPHWQRRPAHWL